MPGLKTSEGLLRSIAAAIVVALLMAAGSAHAGEGQRLRTEPLTVTTGETTHAFTVEVADTADEHATGLMFREDMPADHGMLFVFAGENNRSFWMMNTPLPLDILFISGKGRIVSIAANTTPYALEDIPSGAPAQFVLELNAGTARTLGIAPGDLVASPSMGGQ